MFGILNPPSIGVASVASIYDTVPALSAAKDFLNKELDDSSEAAKWGADISLDGISPEFHQAVAENVLFTRAAMHVGIGQVKRREEGSDAAKIRLLSTLTSLLSGGNV